MPALDQSGFSPSCNAALAKLQQDSDWAHHADTLDLMTAITRLDKYRVIIIDDIDYVKKTREAYDAAAVE